MKTALIVIAVVLSVLGALAGGVYWKAFSHNLPIVEGPGPVPGVETVKDGFVSVFILDTEPGKVALVDCGHDESAKAVLAALTRRGLDASAVQAIFLTHGHGDHIAGCSHFPAAKIFALPAEVPVIGDKLKVTDMLADDGVTKVGSLSVETFAAPGHTPGSAVFLADNVLFFGDSAGAWKDGALHQAVTLFSGSPEGNVASLKHLADHLAPRAADVKWLAFAHTGPLAGFSPLTQFAAAAH